VKGDLETWRLAVARQVVLVLVLRVYLFLCFFERLELATSCDLSCNIKLKLQLELPV
jgi:hypothetical protein